MNNPVLLFDGVCNLCNGMVQFVLKHERDSEIFFGTLQSETGQRYLEKFQLNKEDLRSVVFIENNIVYVKSDAAFKIAGHLKNPWKLLGFFRFMPRAVSNYFYDVVAKYRYRIFGKSDRCMVPAAEWESRFFT